MLNWGWVALGTAGTALITVLVTRLVAWFFEWRSRLVVVVTVNEAFKSTSMYEAVNQLWKKATTLDERLESGSGIFNKYFQFFNADTHVHFVATNNSSKTLKALSFCAHSVGNGLLQIGDGEINEIKSNVPIALGDLQPRRAIHVHFLGATLFASSIKELKKDFTFSAEELGGVIYKFPLQIFHKSRWLTMAGQVFWLVLFICWVFLAITKFLS